MSDVIICPNPDCGQDMDRSILAMCTVCGTDLWALPTTPSAPAPECTTQSPPAVGPGSAGATGTSDATPVGPAVLRLPDGAAIVIPPHGFPVALGRDPVFPDASAFDMFDNVSRRHATVWFDGTTISVKDNGSSNGTWVDGRRLEPGTRTEIGAGQQLRLASNVTISIDRSA